jgi:hypothetical protein
MGNTDHKIDELEVTMRGNFDNVDCPLTHRFTPGLYTREILMPAGTMVTSMIHKTKHQFMVIQGKVSVFSENDGEQIIEAPYVGYTLPGTRRVLLIHENTRWITCHPTNVQPIDDTDKAIEEAVSLITSEIMEPYVNNLLGGQLKNNILYKTLPNN